MERTSFFPQASRSLADLSREQRFMFLGITPPDRLGPSFSAGLGDVVALLAQRGIDAAVAVGGRQPKNAMCDRLSASCYQ